jgi:hypothetical protein
MRNGDSDKWSRFIGAIGTSKRDPKYVLLGVLKAVIINGSVFWIWCHVVRWKSTDISVEHVASIFSVEEYVEQNTSMKQQERY